MVNGHEKHDGALPLVGVNMDLLKAHAGEIATGIELIRSTKDEKGQQIENVRNWQEGRNAVALSHPPRAGDDRYEGAFRAEPPGTENLAYLQNAARGRNNEIEA